MSNINKWMKNFKDIIFIKRLCMAIIGLVLTGVGVGILKYVDLGIDPYNGFATGLGDVTKIGYSTMFIILTALFLVITFVLDKHYIGISTVLTIFIIGNVAQFTLDTLNGISTDLNMVGRVLIMIFGLVLIGISSSLYYTADMGVSSYDAMALIIAKKTSINFKICRITTDLICLVIGFICGVKLGVGTFLTAFCLGPFIEFFIKNLSEPLLHGKNYVKNKK